MGTSRNNNTPKTKFGKRRKSTLKNLKRIQENQRLLSSLK